jgi:hypothetical protein
MSLIELLDIIQSVWYVHDSEDQDKRPLVESYDVKPYLEKLVNDGVKGDDLWEALNDYQPQEIDDIVFLSDYSQSALDSAYEKLNIRYRKAGNLDAGAFVNAKNRNLETEEQFNFSAKSIAIALGIDVSPELVPDEFWGNAYIAELSPIEASEKLLSNLGTM